MFDSFKPLTVNELTDRAFELQSQKFLGLDGVLHRQLPENFLTESVDDQRHGIFLRNAPLLQVKKLLFADF